MASRGKLLPLLAVYCFSGLFPLHGSAHKNRADNSTRFLFFRTPMQRKYAVNAARIRRVSGEDKSFLLDCTDLYFNSFYCSESVFLHGPYNTDLYKSVQKLVQTDNLHLLRL